MMVAVRTFPSVLATALCLCAGAPIFSRRLSIKMDAPSKGCRKVISEFIAIYRDLPQLWDTTSTWYANRRVREEGYVMFLERFRGTCPSITIKEIKSKINTVRTNFRRELKKVKDSGYTYVSSLWYFENLRFLENHLGITAAQSSVKVKQQHHQEEKGGYAFRQTNAAANRPATTLAAAEALKKTYDRIAVMNQAAVSSTSHQNQNHAPEDNKDSEDSNAELSPLMNVKVEIPSSPEPEYQQHIKSINSVKQSEIQIQPLTRCQLMNPQINPLTIHTVRSLDVPSHANQKTQTHIQQLIQGPQPQILQESVEPTEQNAYNINPPGNHIESYQNDSASSNDSVLKGSKNKNQKRKRGNDFGELFNTLNAQFNKKDDEVDLIAQSWAMKLKRMKPEQRIFAEKFIGDIFMEAELGTLCRNSVKIN